jgi:hypothetical protein
LLLLTGSEFVLTFQLQFQLGLLPGSFKPQILFDQLGVAFSFGVEGLVQMIDRVAAGIGPCHQRPERRPTQMRTMSDMGTALFELGTKAELHRHPFRDQGCRSNTANPLSLPAQSAAESGLWPDELNCYCCTAISAVAHGPPE